MGWTWNELMETPYEEYLKIKRISNLEDKKKAEEHDKMQEEIEGAT